MVAWYWIIVAFVIGNAFAAFTYELFEWDNIWVEIVSTLAIIVLYPILAIYHICFKNTIEPVSRERHEKLKEEWLRDRKSKCFNLCEHFCFWVDPEAKQLWNKIFFIRMTEKPLTNNE